MAELDDVWGELDEAESAVAGLSARDRATAIVVAWYDG